MQAGARHPISALPTPEVSGRTSGQAVRYINVHEVLLAMLRAF